MRVVTKLGWMLTRFMMAKTCTINKYNLTRPSEKCFEMTLSAGTLIHTKPSNTLIYGDSYLSIIIKISAKEENEGYTRIYRL